MQENRDWSWVDKDGIEHAAVEDELTFALSSEKLPPYILVCKSGWNTWLPAMQVAELAWALPPGSADTPHKPEFKTSGERLPPPLQAYPALEARAADIKNGVIDPTLGSAVNLPPVAPRPSRPPLETIADEDLLDLSERMLGAATEEEPGSPALLASSPILRPLPAPRRNASAPEIELTEEATLLDDPEAGAPQAALPDVVTPSYAPRVEPRDAARSDWSATPNSSLRWWVAAGLLGGAAIVAWSFSKDSGVTTPARSQPTAEAPANTAAPGRPAMVCEMSAGPSRIGEWVQPKLRPLLRSYWLPGGARVAAGYAKTSRYALGVSLNPENLAVEELFSNYESSPLASVTPLWQDAQLGFRASRAASTLQSQLAIDSPTPFAFGLSKAGFAVRQQDAVVDQVLWPSTWENISIPSAADLGDGRFAVAFRAGGKRGEIQIATLDQTGKGLSAPQTVATEAARVGAPVLTSAQGKLMLAFDAGPTTPRTSIFVGISTLPALPTTVRRVLNSDGGCSAPSISALPNKDTLIQWTIGSPGKQRVVAQIYDDQLAAVSPELSVSPSAKDAHSGTLTVLGSQFLSVYMVRNGENHELWATTFSCL